MLKLAERMVISFCSGVGASIAHQWTTLSGTCGDDVRVMTRKSVDDPGRPLGIVLSAATSFWLPVSPHKVFNFLRNENTRSEVFNLICGIMLSDLFSRKEGFPGFFSSYIFFPRMCNQKFKIFSFISSYTLRFRIPQGQ